jgi:hypothetical protein
VPLWLGQVHLFPKARKIRRLQDDRARHSMMQRVRKCGKWHQPNGDTLSKDKAAPFVVNYEMVDTDKDGKISAAEFTGGCSKGWIQKADTSTVKEMKPKQ